VTRENLRRPLDGEKRFVQPACRVRVSHDNLHPEHILDEMGVTGCLSLHEAIGSKIASTTLFQISSSALMRLMHLWMPQAMLSLADTRRSWPRGSSSYPLPSVAETLQLPVPRSRSVCSTGPPARSARG
jgi:hypothetical protein